MMGGEGGGGGCSIQCDLEVQIGMDGESVYTNNNYFPTF